MSYDTLIGILGLVAIAACWALAVVLFRASLPGSVARKLSALLVVEGFVLASAGFPEFASGLGMAYFEIYYEAHPSRLLALSLVHHLGDAAMIALYPPFLAQALGTRLTRPFAGKSVRLGLAAGAAAFGLAVELAGSTLLTTLFYATVTLLFIYALVASVHAWRTSEPGLTRERAGLFALGFGLRDVGWTLSYAIAAWVMWNGPAGWMMTDTAWLGKAVYALGTLFSVPLIAYGILRTQLFDIDLRIRWTIKQSTLAGIFVALMFLISEGVSQFLSAELGNVTGLLAAAVVMYFLAPLQRFAERVASAAMPNTRNTPEYLAFRKMRVYEAALAEAYQESGVTERERALLVRLRDSLGITASDADAIEAELRSHAA